MGSEPPDVLAVSCHDDQVAAADLHALGATVMSCTPDRFPDVLADALER